MAHRNTVFGQLLTLLPRHEFDAEARGHQRGQRLRVMSRWAQFVALGLGQLASRQSLRDIVSNLRAQPAKLYHLGVGTVSRSSLARVNAEQPYTLYEALFGRLLSLLSASGTSYYCILADLPSFVSVKDVKQPRLSRIADGLQRSVILSRYEEQYDALKAELQTLGFVGQGVSRSHPPDNVWEGYLSLPRRPGRPSRPLPLLDAQGPRKQYDRSRRNCKRSGS